MISNLVASFGLFIGIWFTFVNISKIYYKQKVSKENFIIMSLGWTVFASAMWIFN